jgi:hypothetical protein
MAFCERKGFMGLEKKKKKKNYQKATNMNWVCTDHYIKKKYERKGMWVCDSLRLVDEGCEK